MKVWFMVTIYLCSSQIYRTWTHGVAEKTSLRRTGNAVEKVPLLFSQNLD
jgi:hypothetical protein